MSILMKTIHKRVMQKDSRYAMRQRDVESLLETAKTDTCLAIIYAFAYGFEKGLRCERESQKNQPLTLTKAKGIDSRNIHSKSIHGGKRPMMTHRICRGFFCMTFCVTSGLAQRDGIQTLQAVATCGRRA